MVLFFSVGFGSLRRSLSLDMARNQAHPSKEKQQAPLLLCDVSLTLCELVHRVLI
jgi:hypothetical protein